MIRNRFLTRECWPGAWLFGYICLLIFSSIGAAAEDVNNMPAAASDKYSVMVIGEEAIEEAPWLKKFNLEITDKISGEVKRLTLGGLFSRVRSIESFYLLQKDRLVAVGKLKRAEIVFVIDLKNGKLLDEFWCYAPTISPTGRFLVYKKFYPYHGLPPTRATVVLVYDMRKPPVENRVAVVGYTAWPKEQVGLPIYPEPYVKARAYVLVEEQLQNPNWYNLSSPFLWSADANDIVFLCTHQKQTHIVRVNISAGIENPKIFEAPVIVGNFVKPELPEEFRKKEAARLHMVSATEIHWDGKHHVIAKPNKAYYTLQGKIRLPVP
ncbi:hypothetical protein KA005_08565 [bacterium]|nr:hypothetical protein [bacterium]